MEMAGLNGNQLVVFGDQTNDLKMFRIATEAVAVANATPEVIAEATRVIGTNEDDSVVKYITQHRRNRVGGNIP
jgi:5-amino-6-(5-phospho-D-ribitylamino)uracil phosphatase